MNKIDVLVDTSGHDLDESGDFAKAIIFQDNGRLKLQFESGSTLSYRGDDADGCPIFGWFDLNFHKYAYHYPDGQEDWTTQAIFDELNGVPLEDEVSAPTLLTFTFIKEEKVGDISVTEALQVTQVV
ncbi:hypothetical protein R9D86_000379 [Escherichia coli]|nr:hypothetical protein [Escherichia coli]